MHKITYFCTVLFFSLALFGCNNSPKNFGQVYVDPITDAYKKNGIRSFKIYSNHDDSLFHLQSIKLDSSGQVIWQGFAPEFKNTVTEVNIYDSLGRVRGVIGAKDKRVEYEEDIENGILKEIWSTNGTVSLIRWLKYSPDLKRILEEKWFRASTDTIIYEYQYESDQIQRALKNGDRCFEYRYDELNRLKAIESFGISGYIMVDYISPKTGLVDSTIVWDNSYKKTQVNPQYYRYSQQ